MGSERKRFIISCGMPMAGAARASFAHPTNPGRPTARMTMGIETMKKFLLGTVGLVAFGMVAPAKAWPLPRFPHQLLRVADLPLDRLLHRR